LPPNTGTSSTLSHGQPRQRTNPITVVEQLETRNRVRFPQRWVKGGCTFSCSRRRRPGVREEIRLRQREVCRR